MHTIRYNDIQPVYEWPYQKLERTKGMNLNEEYSTNALLFADNLANFATSEDVLQKAVHIYLLSKESNWVK